MRTESGGIPMSDNVKWTREKILDEAKQCVCGNREQDYGTPEDNFGRIAEFWTTYMGVEFSTVDVAIMMALLKVARIANDQGHMDNYVDGCGYFCIGGELSASERN